MAAPITTSQQFLLNGRAEAMLSPHDRGFAYGDGVFRTLKINQGVPDHWTLHYQKLVEDCNAMGIVCPGAELLLADMARLFSSVENAVAKIIITRGEGARGYALPALAQPTRVVIKAPLPDYSSANFDQGVHLHLCRLRLSHQPRLAGIKHLNRLENVMARMEWTDSSITDGLLLDEDGNAIECTMSNLFARFDDMLLTPGLENCGVAGVTRQRILESASMFGYQAKVVKLPLAELMQADEVIICNSLYGAWQVLSINARLWPLQGLALQLRKFLQG